MFITFYKHFSEKVVQIFKSKLLTLMSATDNQQATVLERKSKTKIRKFCVLLSYCGQEYYGMQRYFETT